jgi:large subunit ribosomal protein L31
MKKDIHPEYFQCTVTCGCGNSFVTGSTRQKINVEICSGCHPFFTGTQKFVDTAGRVEKFQKKFGTNYLKAGKKAKPEGKTEAKA